MSQSKWDGMNAISRQLIGSGVDVVFIPTFAEQLVMPGSRFIDVFTDREKHDARNGRGGPDGEVASLAARWAVKESAIKAWSCAIAGTPPVVPEDQVKWAELEVVCDRWRRPTMRTTGNIHRSLRASLLDQDSDEIHWLISMSHDGDYAMAAAQLFVTRGNSKNQFGHAEHDGAVN